jgi:hypothetical protein
MNQSLYVPSGSYRRPFVIGVNEIYSWDSHPSIYECLKSLGMNAGNILFPSGLISGLANPGRCNFSIPDSILSEADCIVIAAANWINEYEDFGWLAKRLRALNLPAIIVGIGAQPSATSTWMTKIPPGTLDLLDYSRSTSHSISVRGEFTKSVLSQLGFDNTVVTGCPSMLAFADRLPVRLPSPSPQNVLIHATRHGYQDSNSIDPRQKWLYVQSYLGRHGLLLQSEIPDIYACLGRLSNDSPDESISAILKSIYGCQDFSRIYSFLRERGHIFGNTFEWYASISHYTFCLGTRIHGTVSSMLSGVPALLLSHDNRTEELAKSLSIPSMKLSLIDTSMGLDIEAMMEAYNACPAPLKNYHEYVNEFIRFFIANSLRPSSSLLRV